MGDYFDTKGDGTHSFDTGDSLIDKMIGAIGSVPKDAKMCITLNPLAMAHVYWLIQNGHLQPGNNQIEDIIAADKKLGITPWDWPKYS